MSKSKLEKRAYFLTHLFVVLIVILIILTGCSSKPIKEVVVKKEIVVETIPDELFKACRISPLIDRAQYVALECPDRSSYLAKYASDLLYDLKQCENHMLTLKTYNENIRLLYENSK